jgi:hypothetical protein
MVFSLQGDDSFKGAVAALHDRPVVVIVRRLKSSTATTRRPLEEWTNAAEEARPRGAALFPADSSEKYAAIWTGPATDRLRGHPGYVQNELPLWCTPMAQARRQCELGRL